MEANAAIDSLVPRFSLEAKTHVADVFARGDEDTSVIPTGDLPPEIARFPTALHPLPLARSKRTEGVVVYRSDPAICNRCPIKAKCTTSDRGRTIQRPIYEDYLEKVRGYQATEACKEAIRKRQVWVEPLVAEAKEWHGLRRLRLRGS